MPSRKQRRRREKDRRHEYEYVYVDDAGREIAVEDAEAEAETRRDGKSRAAERKNGARAGKPAQVRRTGFGSARTASPPSWSRVLKRAAIFGPLMFVTVALLDRRIGIEGQLLITIQMLLLFVPFSYLVDRMMYRRAQRQAEGTAPNQRASRRGS
jgi:hypothetical protein